MIRLSPTLPFPLHSGSSNGIKWWWNDTANRNQEIISWIAPGCLDRKGFPRRITHNSLRQMALPSRPWTKRCTNDPRNAWFYFASGVNYLEIQRTAGCNEISVCRCLGVTQRKSNYRSAYHYPWKFRFPVLLGTNDSRWNFVVRNSMPQGTQGKSGASAAHHWPS